MFQFYPSTLGYWVLSFLSFSVFFSTNLSQSHVLSRGLVELPELSRVFLCCFNDCFFSFTFHYLVCLRDNLYFFIKFILYEVILVSWLCHKFGKLTQIEFFLSFFFAVHPIFDLLVIELQFVFTFLLMMLSCSDLIFCFVIE